MSGETETVSLNLDGTFEAKAGTGADAGDRLTAAFDKLAAAAARYKDPQVAEASKYSAIAAELDQIAAVNAKIAGFDANRVRALAQQEALLKKMHDDATGETAKRQTADQEKSQAESAGLQMAAAGVFVAAGEKLLQAGVELAKAAADLIISAGELAIAQTSKRDAGEAVLGSMGGDYDATVHTALKLGLNPDAAVTEAKRLLNAHFAQADIEPLLRIKLGMDAKGLDGDGLLKKLETIELKPKVGAKDIDGLAKMGVDAKAVYAELAKELGVTVPAAMAKVKSGAVDSAQAVKAIEAATGSQFGGLADKLAGTVPALFARIKGDGEHLFAFDPSVLDPVKNVLTIIAEALESPAGEALKDSLQDIGADVADLFKDVNKDDVTAFLNHATADFKALGKVLKDNEEGIKTFGRGAALLAEISLDAFTDGLAGAATVAGELGEEGAALGAAWAGALDGIDKFVAGASAFLDGLENGGLEAGLNMAQGLADGIAGGASKAIEAAKDMAVSALDAVEVALKIKSPSQEFADLGDYGAQGLAQGFKSDVPADAAGQMARDAFRAANDNAGPGVAAASAGAGSSSSGGGNSFVFAPNIALPPGSGAEVEAAVARALAAAYPEFLALVRREMRERAA